MYDNACVRRAQDNGFCGMFDTADIDLGESSILFFLSETTSDVSDVPQKPMSARTRDVRRVRCITKTNVCAPRYVRRVRCARQISVCVHSLSLMCKISGENARLSLLVRGVQIVVIISCHTPCQSTPRDSTELIFIMSALLLVDRKCKPTAQDGTCQLLAIFESGVC